jgi:hypothetical protein
VSDVLKLAIAGAPMQRLLPSSAAFVLGLSFCLLVSLDMHYTARHFHARQESLTAMIAGGALFQVRPGRPTVMFNGF